MPKPEISVVMSVYNGQPFLQEALNSIGAQTFTDYEFLIVNDGSTDETENTLDRYRRADPRVKIFNNRHCGLVAALNFGGQLAEGEFIARLDADDISVPDRFERQIDFLNRNKQVAVLGGVMCPIWKDGAQFNEGFKLDSEPLSNAEIKNLLKVHNCIGHNTVMLRTRAFHEIGGYRSAFPEAEDYDLWLRVSEKYEIAKLPEVLTYYRLHCNQVSVRKVEQQAISVLASQASARIRLATGLDPISNEDRATRLLLKKLGVKDETIDSRIISGYLAILSLAAKYLILFCEDKPIIAEQAMKALTFCDSIGSTADRMMQLRSLAQRLLADCSE